jgi:hypothetical protein
LANGGFAFDLSNAGDNASQINSNSVSKLKLALTHAGAGETEKRGAPAVTYNDPKKGSIMVDSVYSAALSVTNDVVFAASFDGVVKSVSCFRWS